MSCPHGCISKHGKEGRGEDAAAESHHKITAQVFPWGQRGQRGDRGRTQKSELKEMGGKLHIKVTLERAEALPTFFSLAEVLSLWGDHQPIGCEDVC